MLQRIFSCNSSGPIDCSLPDPPPLKMFPGQSVELWLMVLGGTDSALSGDVELLAFLRVFRFLILKNSPRCGKESHCSGTLKGLPIGAIN